MTRFTVPKRDEVSPANQSNFDALKQMLGMVPNLFATMAYSENALSRYLALDGSKTSLSNKEKEAVNLVVSEVNGCRYCLSAHTVLGKMNGFTDEEIFRLRRGHATDQKLNALTALAKDITENQGRVNDARLEAFFAAGYDRGNLVDLILQVADKIFANYLHNLTEVPIDFPVAESLKAFAN